MLSEGYYVMLLSGAEWLRDSTKNCFDVKKVVFFMGTRTLDYLRTSTMGIRTSNVLAYWADWLEKFLTI